jgi:hypothetical protein
MATFLSENSVGNKTEFVCEICDYKCFKNQYWKQHLITKKHKIRIFNNVANSGNTPILTCFCGKVYKDRSGLWRHKKYCKELVCDEIKNINAQTQLTPELVMKLHRPKRKMRQNAQNVMTNI